MFLSIGVSKEEFLDSAPVDLECYIEAEKMAQRRRDTENWQMGMYNMSAFGVVLSKALSGKKSKAKYVEQPILEKVYSDVQKEEEILSEEQIENERSKLLAQLMTMQANFELNHSGGD